jgi:site-specific DNA recombinase
MAKEAVSKNARHDVGIWIRVSTEDQVRGESPEHHERRARGYADAKGWNVKEVYRLDAVSGKSVMGQPETQRMLGDIASGHITGLIFSKLARLARNTRELLDFAEIFRARGADLVSLQESIDTSTPAGRLFYTMIAAMAQWEREEISERVAASVPIRARLGKPLGGAAPFGYRWENRKLIPDPTEAPIRLLVHQLFLAHRRKKTGARILNDAGHRTRNGSRFSDTTVDRLIRDPTAKGVRRANYTKSLGDKKHWVLKPESEWVLGEVEPIVSCEVWDQALAALDERRATGKRPARRPVHLFAGQVECACGTKMYVPSNSPKYICSKCRTKIPAVDLETIFHEQLKDGLLSPETVAEYLEKNDERISEIRRTIESLTADQKRVRNEMDKVYQLYVQDKISADGFDRTYRPLETRAKQMEEEIPQLEAEADFLRIQQISRDDVFSQVDSLHTHWDRLEAADRRRIVETILDRIVVDEGSVSIEFAFIPAASKVLTARQRNFRDSWPRPIESETEIRRSRGVVKP